MGAGGRREQLALGETPNVAARLRIWRPPIPWSSARPCITSCRATLSATISAPPRSRAWPRPSRVSCRGGERGAESLGHRQPQELHPVGGAGGGSHPAAGPLDTGERWPGPGGLTSGEAGIGKSRLVQVLKDHLAGEPHTRLEFRCSPYHTNSALYPVIDLWQRVLRFDTADAPADKLHKLEQMLAQSRLSLPTACPFCGPAVVAR